MKHSTKFSNQDDHEQQTNQWAFLLHLSQLTGIVAPFVGLLAPIIIWQIKKYELPEIDLHGKMVVNWLISQLIYVAICFSLSLVAYTASGINNPIVLIAFPLIFVVGLLGLIFPIIGGVKAKTGTFWNYPLTLPLLK